MTTMTNGVNMARLRVYLGTDFFGSINLVNRIPNPVPSAATDLYRPGVYGWELDPSQTPMHLSYTAGAGGYLQCIVDNPSGAQIAFSSAYVPVTAGEFYGATVQLVALGAGAAAFSWSIGWYDDTNALLSTSGYSGWVTALGAYAINGVAAPAGATKARINCGGASNLSGGSVAQNGYVRIANACLTRVAASASVPTYHEDYPRTDITGYLRSLEIGVTGFDVRTFHADLVSSITLDPASNPMMVRGNNLDVVFTDTTGDMGTVGKQYAMIRGRLDDAVGKYDPKPSTPVNMRLSVTLTASDDIDELQGYSTVSNVNTFMPGYLARVPLNGNIRGLGWAFCTSNIAIPYNLAGNTDPGSVFVGSWCSSIGNPMSLYDLTVLVADSDTTTGTIKPAYRWMDRNGILNVTSTLPAGTLPNGATLTLDDTTTNETTSRAGATDIDLGFNRAECINTVAVSTLVPPATGQTKWGSTVKRGPYYDRRSVRAYGTTSASYVITTDSSPAAEAQTFAKNIITANKSPIHGPRSVAWTVSDTTAAAAAVADLYTAVTVGSGGRTWTAQRIKGLRHSITVDPNGRRARWRVAYDFMDPTNVSVASGPVSSNVTGAAISSDAADAAPDVQSAILTGTGTGAQTITVTWTFPKAFAAGVVPVVVASVASTSALAIAGPFSVSNTSAGIAVRRYDGVVFSSGTVVTIHAIAALPT